LIDSVSTIRTLTSYPGQLPHPFKRALVLTTALTVVVTMLDGIGLALIIPLVELLIGLDSSASETSIIRWVQNGFEWFGLDLSVGMLVTVILLIQVVRVLGMALQIWLNSLLKVRFEKQLRSETYELILAASWLHFTSKKSGNLMNVLISQSQRAGDTLSSYGGALAAIVTTLIYLAAAVLISWNLSLLAALYTFLIIIALSFFLKIGRNLGIKISESIGQLTIEVTESLGGLKAIKAAGMESTVTGRFTKMAAELEHYSSVYGLSHGVMNSTAEAFFLIAMLAGLVFASSTLGLPAGALLLFALLFFRMFQRAKAFQQAMLEFFQVEPGLEIVRNAQREAKASPERSGGQPFENFGTGVEISNLSFKYAERSSGLEKISIEILTGKSTAIVGPSGAGKTTVIDLVVGLISPDDGEITVGDQVLAEVSLNSWRSNIAYVTQGTLLFNDTVAKNVALGELEVDHDLLVTVCAQSGVDTFVSELPDGYDTAIGERGVRLSGGQRQRIALARALYRQPQLLILDEATSELDTHSERRFQETIDQLHGNLTILMVAHRLSTVMKVDNIYVLDQGQITESGSAAELLEARGMFYSMINEGSSSNNSGAISDTSSEPQP
jgi:ATP-binding cassette, subfamily C, bacterial